MRTRTPYFDGRAEDYDTVHLALEPSARIVDELVMGLLHSDAHGHRPWRVLDLGGGTGRIAEQILGTLDASTVLLLDFSPGMTTAAATRLARFGERSQVICKDIDSFQPPRGQFDLVLAMLSLHHLTRMARSRVYRRVAAALKYDGRFIIFEHSRHDLPPAAETLDSVRRQGALVKAIAENVVTAERIRMMEESRLCAAQAERDKKGRDTFNFESAIRGLRTAGFRHMCVLFRTLADVVLVARR